MTNQEMVMNKLQQEGVTGTYNEFLDKLSKKELKKVLEGIDYGGNTDIPVSIRRKKYVIQIEYWDYEISFHPISNEKYEEMFF